MISAIVFTFWPEEADHIETCFKTLAFADEIIVIDNGATPTTLALAKKYATKIEHSTSNSFAERHNLGAKLAKGDWLLYIDADERISKKLQEEITTELLAPHADAYQLHRVNYYLGSKVRYGDRYPDLVVRLFKKSKLTGWTGDIHESSSVSGKIGKFASPLYHLTHTNIFSMMDKTKNYAEIEARVRFEAHHPKVVGWRLVRVFLTEFYTRLIKYQGLRGGTSGWIDGIFQAVSMFIVYARLWEMQRKPSLKETYKDIDTKILEEWT